MMKININALVFSKAFKRNTGYIPTLYRTEHFQATRKFLEDNKDILDELMSEESLRKLQQRKWHNDEIIQE